MRDALSIHSPWQTLEDISPSKECLGNLHSSTPTQASLALTVMLLVGGGTYLETNLNPAPKPSNEAAVVHDLQTLDNNAQLLDTLEDLSQNNNGE